MPNLHHTYAGCKDPFTCGHLTHVLSPIVRKRTADEEEIVLYKNKPTSVNGVGAGIGSNGKKRKITADDGDIMLCNNTNNARGAGGKKRKIMADDEAIVVYKERTSNGCYGGNKVTPIIRKRTADGEDIVLYNGASSSKKRKTTPFPKKRD